MRIGILGGSFDPPHLGHTALAECAVMVLNLDLLVVAVAFRQWQKQHDADAASRYDMAKLNFQLPKMEISRVDLDRQTPTFTIDTLEDLAAQYPNAEFIFITGADAIAGLASWHRASELAAKLKFAAAPRSGIQPETPTGFDVLWMDCELPDISSTEIRNRLEQANRNLDSMTDLLAAPVREYIAAKNLYR